MEKMMINLMDTMILRKFSTGFEVLDYLKTDKEEIKGHWFYDAASSGALSFITSFKTEETTEEVKTSGNKYKIHKVVADNEQQISNKMTIYKNIKLDWLFSDVMIKNGQGKVYLMRVEKMIDNKYIVLRRVKTFDIDTTISIFDKLAQSYRSFGINENKKTYTYEELESILKGA